MAEQDQQLSRYVVLNQVIRKVAYATPVFLALSASQVLAASGDFDSACADAGSPCNTGADSCAGLA